MLCRTENGGEWRIAIDDWLGWQRNGKGSVGACPRRQLNSISSTPNQCQDKDDWRKLDERGQICGADGIDKNGSP